MADTGISVSEIKACVQAIKDEVQKIESDINNLQESVDSIKASYRALRQYDGKYMEDETKKTQLTLEGKKVEATYRLVAHQSSGQEASQPFAAVMHLGDDAKRDCIDKIRKILEDIDVKAEYIEEQNEVAERGLIESLEDTIGDSVGGGGVAGGGAAFIGAISTPTASSIKKTESIDSTGTTLGQKKSYFDNSSRSESSDYAKKPITNVSEKADDPSSFADITGSKDGTSSLFDKEKNTSSSIRENSQHSSQSGSQEGSHSGGGFSGTTGYIGNGTDDEKSKKDEFLNGTETSIDDIVSGNKKNRIASASAPVLGNGIVKGSAVIPVVSGLSAAGASGLGLTALMGKKKDDDDDDDLEKADENAFMKEEDILKKEDEKETKTLDDFDEYTDNTNDNFVNPDLKESSSLSEGIPEMVPDSASSNYENNNQSLDDLDDFSDDFYEKNEED